MLRFVLWRSSRAFAGSTADPAERAAAFADACRLNALYMIERAGSGHPGTTFSSLDIVAWLHLEVLGEGDRYFSSKGHDAPGLYAVLAGARPARLRPDPPAAEARRPARAPGRGRDAGGRDEHRLARDGGLEGARLRARRPRPRPLRPRLRPHRRRRAAGGPVLGVAPADREPGAARDHRDRRPQPGAVGHVGVAGERPRRPRGEVPSFGWAVARCDGHDLRAFAETLEGFGGRGAAAGS